MVARALSMDQGEVKQVAWERELLSVLGPIGTGRKPAFSHPRQGKHPAPKRQPPHFGQPRLLKEGRHPAANSNDKDDETPEGGGITGQSLWVLPIKISGV